ncbi:MAG: archease [Aquificae bacterium]|nr:archease [Aquificota bacterium]
MIPYEQVSDVTAEAGIRLRAPSLEELFCGALLATFNEITELSKVEPKEEKTLEVTGVMPFLLADLINAALLLHERDKFVPRSCEVLELTPEKVKVKLKGERFDPSRHEPKTVIKAATYYRLRVEKKDGEYEAEVIFDV